MVKRITIIPMDNTGGMHHRSKFDLNLHINILDIRLSKHGYSMVGALCFMGIVVRHSRYFQPIAYGFSGQINFPISNVQIIDLHYVDPTNVKKIFGKQDIFQHLLKSRGRLQLLDADYSNGWAINDEERIGKYYKYNDPRSLHMYIVTKKFH